MIPPIETDDARDALRTARDAIGAALDELNRQGAPASIVTAFSEAHDACSWCVERVTDAMRAVTADRRQAEHMEAVEERHIDAQIFPHMDDL